MHEIFPDQDCIFKESEFACLFSNMSVFQESRRPITGIGITVESGKITKITAIGDFPNKSLRKLINELGFPDEAYMYHLMGGEGFAESSLLLIFNEFHAVIEYYKGIQMTTGPSLSFCINGSDQPSIELFPEKKQINFLELSNYSNLPYQSFSDVIGVRFSDYYQNNISNDGTLCIKSNKDEWR